MTEFRTETDLLGERRVPAMALTGIHSLRATENFPLSGRPVAPALVRAYGAVKLACATANHALGAWDEPTFAAIATACREVMAGALDGEFRTDALQGGAGTSTNMSLNEVIANRALVLLGRAPGDHAVIHPLDDINRHQSTNDTYPTALRVAAIGELRRLVEALVGLLGTCQRREQDWAGIVKVGRTEMQDAVLATLGHAAGAWAEAFGRDRWRLYKCEERLRVVNLGGTAIGTGLGAPRDYIFRVVNDLNAITGLGLARAENLVEATQNQDALAEVSGILSAAAANLMKIAGDLRLLSSGPDAGLGEIRLPPRQAGSSLMPGKVNPVIPEAVTQAAIMVQANHQAIAWAVGLGSLELNPFMPLIADRLLDSLALLRQATIILDRHCLAGAVADEARCRRHVDGATATLTALVGALGHGQADDLARRHATTGGSLRDLVMAEGLMSADQFDALLAPEAVTRLGSPPPNTN
jgi:aspartate ammonia-lyase